MKLESSVRGIQDVQSLAQFLTEARLVTRALNVVLAEDGLRDDLWRIMNALSHSKGMLMGELSETLVVPPATVTRLVDELTDSGLVFRSPSADDGRKVAVQLSRMGKVRLERVESLLQVRLLHWEQ